MSRDRALAMLQEPVYEEMEIRLEIEFFCRMIGVRARNSTGCWTKKPTATRSTKTWIATSR